MRFIVLGAGAIGGVIGGRLFEHGHEVILIARGANQEALLKGGLRLESPDAVLTLPIPTVSDPGEIAYRDDDVVLLTVKSHDTITAVRALASVAPPALRLVCAQNGVENERIGLRRFASVYGMCVMVPATHLVPGTVQAYCAPVTGLLDLGVWPAGADDTARAISTALRASTFGSEVREDIARWKWGKLILNLGNAVEAVCGPAARSGEITRRAQSEGLACLEVAGIAYVGHDEDVTRRGNLLTLRPVSGLPRGGGSSWQSLARSTGAIETDYLNGEIVLLGRESDVATPVNALLQQLANRLAREGRPPGSVSEAAFLRLLG